MSLADILKTSFHGEKIIVIIRFQKNHEIAQNPITAITITKTILDIERVF
jgi:hypothetical protein